LVLPDPIIESVIAYVQWLLWCSRNAVTSKVAASIGFIPSDDVIDELFPKLWRASFRADFPVHLGITVAEDADKPTIHRLDLSETGT
jgi:hypothetical protein